MKHLHEKHSELKALNELQFTQNSEDMCEPTSFVSDLLITNQSFVFALNFSLWKSIAIPRLFCHCFYPKLGFQ